MTVQQTARMLAQLLPHVDELSPDAAQRVVAGARAVAAAATDATARDRLVAALVRLPQVPVEEVFDILGHGAWAEHVVRGLVSRPDLGAADCDIIMRTVTTKGARRAAAEDVRSVALAERLASTEDPMTLIAMVGNYGLPQVWRGRLAARVQATIPPGSTRLWAQYRDKLASLNTEGAFALLEQVPNAHTRLTLMCTNGMLIGQDAWTRVAHLLVADAAAYRATLGGSPSSLGRLREAGHFYDVLRSIANRTDVPTRQMVLEAFKPLIVVGNGDPLEKVLQLPLPAEATNPDLINWQQVTQGQLSGLTPVDVLTLLDDSLGRDPSRWVTLVAIGDQMRGTTGEVLDAVATAFTD